MSKYEHSNILIVEHIRKVSKSKGKDVSVLHVRSMSSTVHPQQSLGVPGTPSRGYSVRQLSVSVTRATGTCVSVTDLSSRKGVNCR